MKIAIKKPKIFRAGEKKTLARLIEFWWLSITSSFFLGLIILALVNFYLFFQINNDLLWTNEESAPAQFKKVNREKLQETVRFIEGKTGERILQSGVDLPQDFIDRE